MPHFDGVAPVLTVRRLSDALNHYSKLGFAVTSYDDSYAFAVRDDVQLHLAQLSDIDPATSNVSAYLYVDDADALFAQWQAAGVEGRLRAPQDTDYGLREGAHVDPDGNLLRFGSRIAKS